MAVREETGIGFGVVGSGNLTPFAGRILDDNDVAVLREYTEGTVLIGVNGGWRGEAGFFLGELTQTSTVAIHDIGIERLKERIGCLFPLEIDQRTVAGPADLRGFSADQSRTAHDVVDGELKLFLRGGGKERTQGKERSEGNAENGSKHVLSIIAWRAEGKAHRSAYRLTEGDMGVTLKED